MLTTLIITSNSELGAVLTFLINYCSKAQSFCVSRLRSIHLKHIERSRDALYFTTESPISGKCCSCCAFLLHHPISRYMGPSVHWGYDPLFLSMAVQFASKRSILLIKLISSQSIFSLKLYTSLFILIRFDTFTFDYDTKNVIIFSNKIVLQPVRQALPYNVFLPGDRIDSLNKSLHQS